MLEITSVIWKSLWGRDNNIFTHSFSRSKRSDHRFPALCYHRHLIKAFLYSSHLSYVIPYSEWWRINLVIDRLWRVIKTWHSIMSLILYRFFFIPLFWYNIRMVNLLKYMTKVWIIICKLVRFDLFNGIASSWVI